MGIGQWAVSRGTGVRKRGFDLSGREIDRIVDPTPFYG